MRTLPPTHTLWTNTALTVAHVFNTSPRLEHWEGTMEIAPPAYGRTLPFKRQPAPCIFLNKNEELFYSKKEKTIFVIFSISWVNEGWRMSLPLHTPCPLSDHWECFHTNCQGNRYVMIMLFIVTVCLFFLSVQIILFHIVMSNLQCSAIASGILSRCKVDMSAMY